MKAPPLGYGRGELPLGAAGCTHCGDCAQPSSDPVRRHRAGVAVQLHLPYLLCRRPGGIERAPRVGEPGLGSARAAGGHLHRVRGAGRVPDSVLRRQWQRQRKAGTAVGPEVGLGEPWRSPGEKGEGWRERGGGCGAIILSVHSHEELLCFLLL